MSLRFPQQPAVDGPQGRGAVPQCLFELGLFGLGLP